MREEAAALDPGDDPALRSFHDEGVRSLETFDLVRRVISHRQRTIGHPQISFPLRPLRSGPRNVAG